MDHRELHKKFDAVASEVGLSTNEVARLCVDMLKTLGDQSFAEKYDDQCVAVQKNQESLRVDMAKGARRTNGSLTFPL